MTHFVTFRCFLISSFIYMMCCRATHDRTVDYRHEELGTWEALDTERAVLRSLVYVLLLVVACITAFFNVLYGVTFNSRDNRSWINGVLVGLITGTSDSSCCRSVLC